MNTSNRKISVIMCTDIVGYTAMMNRDENEALIAIEANREWHQSVVQEFQGVLVKEIGDGNLMTFAKIDMASRAALKLIAYSKETNLFQLKIGIHHDEIIVDNNDILGNAVNLTFRIQEKAAVGKIVITEIVRQKLLHVPEFQLTMIGKFHLKNIAGNVTLYQLNAPDETVEKDISINYNTINPQDNSIVVLPFVNLSSDPEQDYFSDGITTELINTFCKVKDLKVTGRTSSFLFKGKDIDARTIGERLNVKNILEGSVQKSGNRLRVSSQLINASDGYNIWSEKYDLDIVNVFDMQEQLSLSILAAVKIQLKADQKKIVSKRNTSDPEAYTLYLKAQHYYLDYAPASWNMAIKYFKACILLDPNYAAAYAGLSCCYQLLWFYGVLHIDDCMEDIQQNAEIAMQLDDQLADSHVAYIRIHNHISRDFYKTKTTLDKIISLRPNDSESLYQYGLYCGWNRYYDEARKYIHKAQALDPLSPMGNWMAGITSWLFSDYKAMDEIGDMLISTAPEFYGGYTLRAISYNSQGEYAKAIKYQIPARERHPNHFHTMILAFYYGQIGDNSKALELKNQIKSDEPNANYFYACIFAALRDWDQMYHHITLACNHHDGQLFWFRRTVDDLDIDKTDPRYNQIMKKIGYLK